MCGPCLRAICGCPARFLSFLEAVALASRFRRPANRSIGMQADSVTTVDHLTSYRTRRTLPCREEVDVSVLTPANEAPRDAIGVWHLWESREPAGRARRRAERENTIVNEWRVLERSRNSGKGRDRGSFVQS